jgi:hypothetical protein
MEHSHEKESHKEDGLSRNLGCHHFHGVELCSSDRRMLLGLWTVPTKDDDGDIKGTANQETYS